MGYRPVLCGDTRTAMVLETGLVICKKIHHEAQIMTQLAAQICGYNTTALPEQLSHISASLITIVSP